MVELESAVLHGKLQDNLTSDSEDEFLCFCNMYGCSDHLGYVT